MTKETDKSQTENKQKSQLLVVMEAFTKAACDVGVTWVPFFYGRLLEGKKNGLLPSEAPALYQQLHQHGLRSIPKHISKIGARTALAQAYTQSGSFLVTAYAPLLIFQFSAEAWLQQSLPDVIATNLAATLGAIIVIPGESWMIKGIPFSQIIHNIPRSISACRGLTPTVAREVLCFNAANHLMTRNWATRTCEKLPEGYQQTFITPVSIAYKYGLLLGTQPFARLAAYMQNQPEDTPRQSTYSSMKKLWQESRKLAAQEVSNTTKKSGSSAIELFKVAKYATCPGIGPRTFSLVITACVYEAVGGAFDYATRPKPPSQPTPLKQPANNLSPNSGIRLLPSPLRPIGSSLAMLWRAKTQPLRTPLQSSAIRRISPVYRR